jgi:hypothetical protein
MMAFKWSGEFKFPYPPLQANGIFPPPPGRRRIAFLSNVVMMDIFERIMRQFDAWKLEQKYMRRRRTRILRKLSRCMINAGLFSLHADLGRGIPVWGWRVCSLESASFAGTIKWIESFQLDKDKAECEHQIGGASIRHLHQGGRTITYEGTMGQVASTRPTSGSEFYSGRLSSWSRKVLDVYTRSLREVTSLSSMAINLDGSLHIYSLWAMCVITKRERITVRRWRRWQVWTRRANRGFQRRMAIRAGPFELLV